MDYYRDIMEFHRKFGLDYDGKPRALVKELAIFRVKFLIEELIEYINASTEWPLDRDEIEEIEELLLAPLRDYYSEGDLEKKFDALIDLQYVTLGTAYLHGFKMDEGWRRVHAANMQKMRCERPADSTRGSTFDVIKGPNWRPPVLSDLLD